MTTIRGWMGVLMVVALPLGAQEQIDNAAINKIKDEGMNRSQVMTISSWLEDVNGPRLTSSPYMHDAGNWTLATMKQWGLSNSHFELWPFGVGWVADRFSLQALGPHAWPVIAYPMPWSEGLPAGPMKGNAVFVAGPVTKAWIDSMGAKLKGVFLLQGAERPVAAHFTPDASRYTDSALTAMEKIALTPPAPRPQAPPAAAPPAAAPPATPPPAPVNTDSLLRKAGVIAILVPNTNAGGVDGDVFSPNGSPPRKGSFPKVPRLVVSTEHYNRIVREIKLGQTVPLELDLKVHFTPDTMSYNIVAEIPGTDPTLKAQLVVIGGHFDSWSFGTGATDNGAGSAVMLEAMRILKTVGLPMKRTVRIVLWTGEEQGLCGSKEYVHTHFGGPFTQSAGCGGPVGRGGAPVVAAVPAYLPEQKMVSAYYNLDNGTGKIRGVYLQGNDKIAPIFRDYMKPFNDMGMKTLTISNTGGTDHLSFDAVNIPGFQFIQDPIDYGTRTHHSSQDLYDRLQPDDMKFNATVVAAFVYMTANRTEMMPRKQ